MLVLALNFLLGKILKTLLLSGIVGYDTLKLSRIYKNYNFSVDLQKKGSTKQAFYIFFITLIITLH